MPKGKAKSQARSRLQRDHALEDPSVFTLIEDHTEDQIADQAGEIIRPANPLEIRVMQIENALARVMDFLDQNHAAQTEQK